MTILEAAANLRARRVSSVELTRAALDSAARLQGAINAFITLLEESAMERARAMDDELTHGESRGPLHGIPYAVKDNVHVKGFRTTCGTKVFANQISDHDAAVVERLTGVGAVLIGKAGLHEMAYGITSNNPHYGAVRNPWNTAHVPGGSSGGSGAAVSAGIVAMAIGSDTGGSVRIPASFCGTVGLKPTWGRASRYGLVPLGPTLDHVGPLTASVRDAALTLDVIAGYDPRDGASARVPAGDYLPKDVSVSGLRVGIPENFFYDQLDADVAQALRAAAQRFHDLGAIVTPLRVPDIAGINAVGRILQLSETSALMASYRDRRADFGPDVMHLMDQGRLIPATDYVNAQRLRRIYQREFRALWQTADVLLVPSTPIPAPRIGQQTTVVNGVEEDVRLASTRMVRSINVLGLPALSIPVGLTRDRLPIGAQLIAKPFDEATLLRAGAALEDSGISALGRPHNLS